MDTTDEINAKTRSRRDAEKIENILAAQVIGAVKATEQEQAVHKAQVLTYLRLTELKLGLLLNFGQKMLRDGTERIVNDL